MVIGDVVLIHGFWSSPATWDRLAGVLGADPELGGVRWHRFAYESPKVSVPLLPTRIPDYDDIAQSLRPYLAAHTPNRNVAIVTHSQGGLILQRYLAWTLNEGRGRELARIRSIVMLACPHEGTDYLRSIRAVLGFRFHPQAGALGTLDRGVATARRTVLNQVVHASAVSDRECPIPVHVYARRTDKVVRRVPAQSAFPNAAVLPGDHFSILDAQSPGSLTAPTVKRHLLQDLATVALESVRTDDRSGNAVGSPIFSSESTDTRGHAHAEPVFGAVVKLGQGQAVQAGVGLRSAAVDELRWPRRVGSVPLLAGHFQHRIVARELDQMIRAGRTAVLSQQVLTGLGGVGKTQLAAEYAGRVYDNDEVDLLVWVTATSREAIVSQFAEAADVVESAKQDTAEHAAVRFLTWLERTSRKWLIVLDDVAKPAHLDGLWPPHVKHGRTIVTTRRRDTVLNSQGRRLVEVGSFTHAEARNYLNAALVDMPALADDVDGVVVDLGCLPLALSHAAAFMMDRRLSCAEYRRRFADRHRRLPDLFTEADALPDQYQRTIATTWSLSIDAADELEPVGLARPMIQLASVLDPNGIPQAVLNTEAARRWLTQAVRDGNRQSEVDEARARDAQYCLHRLNLAAVGDTTIRVHALVQRAVRDDIGDGVNDVLHTAAAALREAWQRDPTLGWSTLSTLVKVADDTDDNRLQRSVFNQLLAMLDGRDTEEQVARAWDATYVIEDNLPLVLPFVLECLDNTSDQAESDAGSRLGPPTRLTQQAASSLASAFSAVEDWRAADPARAIPVLRGCLTRWTLRRRFIEALARYRHPDALQAILDFTAGELRSGDDPGVLGVIAAALGQLGHEFGEAERAACIDVLREIAARQDLNPKTVRVALLGLSKLDDHLNEIPDVTEAEIIANLSPFADRGAYSDWVDVQDAADYAYRRIASGHGSPQLLDALLRALEHPHTAVRPSIARCLARIDDPRARAALLAEALKPTLPTDVRSAYLQAFTEQVRSAPTPLLQALRRWQLLNVAQRGAETAPLAAAELIGLATALANDQDHLVTEGALELLPAATGDQADATVRVRIIGPEDAPIRPDVTQIVTPADIAQVGPDKEQKYRICAVRRNAGELRVDLAATTWTQGASFQRALRRLAPLPIDYLDAIMHAALCGQAHLPGTASVHCVLVSQDRKVVLTLRAKRSEHSAGLWSASFEEQLTDRDFALAENPIVAAARRGFAEEFRLPAAALKVSVLSAMLETKILNVAMLAVVETRTIADDIRRAVNVARASRDAELDAVEFVNASAEALHAAAQRPDLHPTSSLRLHMLARHLRLAA